MFSCMTALVHSGAASNFTATIFLRKTDYLASIEKFADDCFHKFSTNQAELLS